MSLTARKHVFLLSRRNFSASPWLCQQQDKKPKQRWQIKYRNRFQEMYSERNPFQKLVNRGKGLLPFDKRLEITGKNTGPSVEGGSELAAKLAAKHVVPVTGFYNKHGRFINVKNMRPNFVVPDLRDFQLKPYVGYKTIDVSTPVFTAIDLYKEEYKAELQEDMKKIEMGVPLEEVLADRMKIIDAEEHTDKQTKTDQKIESETQSQQLSQESQPAS